VISFQIDGLALFLVFAGYVCANWIRAAYRDRGEP